MLNLLLKDQKKKIVHQYRMRFLVVFLALTFAGEVISLILIFPSYITARTRLNILSDQSVSLKIKNVTTETSNLSETVQQTNNYLNILTASSAPNDVVAILRNITDIRGVSVKMDSFVYSTQNDGQQVVIHGTANSRQTLLDFVKKLKALPGVVSADLPVSDFAQSQNIDFSVTVMLNPQHI